MAWAGVRAWGKRWVQTPVVTIVLGVGLFASLWSLPRDSTRVNCSTIGALFGRTPMAISTATRGGDVVYVLRDGTVATIKNPDSDSWDEMTRLLAERPSDVLQVGYTLGRATRSGFYALTSEQRAWTVRVTRVNRAAAGSDAADPEEAALARAALAKWLDSTGGGQRTEDARRIASGDVIEARALWSGYLHDAGALVGSVIFLYSLAWIPRAPAWLARSRSQRRLARGQCPHCSYSIAGLKENFCPECGKGWNLTAEDDVPAESAP